MESRGRATGHKAGTSRSALIIPTRIWMSIVDITHEEAPSSHVLLGHSQYWCAPLRLLIETPRPIGIGVSGISVWWPFAEHEGIAQAIEHLIKRHPVELHDWPRIAGFIDVIA